MNWRLRPKKMGKHWWVIGDDDDGPYGPYPTRKEASESAAAVMEFFKNEDRQSFFTIEPKKK